MRDGPGVEYMRNEVSLSLDTFAAPALVCSTLTCTSLLLSTPVKHLWCLVFDVQFQPGKQSLWSLMESKSVFSEPEGSWLPLVPDWPGLMQMKTLSLPRLIGSKGTALNGQNEMTLIG